MSKITVDHSRFKMVAEDIEAHVNEVKSQINSSNVDLGVLSGSYQGSDYFYFREKFEKIIDKDSTYQKYIDALTGYAEFLKFAAEEYKKAQIEAYNKAAKLPK